MKMSKLYLRVYPERIVGTQVFSELSREELRVLLAAAASDSEITEEELAETALCSLSRCKAALTLFSSEGIAEISDTPFEDSVIEYEHKETASFSDIEEDSPKKVAENIRHYDLSELLDECAEIMKKAALSSAETAKIVSLVTNLSLSGEYISALLSHLQSKKQGTVTRLVKKAEELVGRGIDSYDTLEEYIRSCEIPGYVYEYRKVLGIYGRAVSQTERECYKKWAEEFDYDNEILALAYDKSVLANSAGSLSYIDRVLTSWHEAGCKTLADCEENSKSFKDAREAQKKEHSETKKQRSKTDAKTPRYGNFDVEEAFMLALSRSYGDEEKEDNN